MRALSGLRRMDIAWYCGGVGLGSGSGLGFKEE